MGLCHGIALGNFGQSTIVKVVVSDTRGFKEERAYYRLNRVVVHYTVMLQVLELIDMQTLDTRVLIINVLSIERHDVYQQLAHVKVLIA